jgi:hypothetical protein
LAAAQRWWQRECISRVAAVGSVMVERVGIGGSMVAVLVVWRQWRQSGGSLVAAAVAAARQRLPVWRQPWQVWGIAALCNI